MKNLIYTLFFCLAVTQIIAQDASQVFKAAGTPENPKVTITWNRYYNHAGITELCKKLAAAHPDLIKLGTIGKSFQGREMWVLSY